MRSSKVTFLLMMLFGLALVGVVFAQSPAS